MPSPAFFGKQANVCLGAKRPTLRLNRGRAAMRPTSVVAESGEHPGQACWTADRVRLHRLGQGEMSSSTRETSSFVPRMLEIGRRSLEIIETLLPIWQSASHPCGACIPPVCRATGYAGRRATETFSAPMSWMLLCDGDASAPRQHDSERSMNGHAHPTITLHPPARLLQSLTLSKQSFWLLLTFVDLSNDLSFFRATMPSSRIWHGALRI